MEPIIGYDQSQQWLLNSILALITLGIALELRVADFIAVLRQPRAIFVGALAQLLVLPAATWVLISLVPMHPGIALGLLMAACCPGGGMSNFFTSLAKGNVALSVSMTAISSSIAMLMLPINFLFWASINSDTSELLRAFDIDRGEFILNLLMILLIPLLVGLMVRHFWAGFAHGLMKPLRVFSLMALLTFVLAGIGGNLQLFSVVMAPVLLLVTLHNAMALGIGYLVSRAGGLSVVDRRAITLEVGIQNNGLGLAIIFAFFDGNGHMALVAAWWGVWHLVSGAILAWLFSRRPLQ
ncbi:bile acid:sodium symporter family protein [Aestuariirhabdus litorea]|uniref:Bile acid:sodium symporter family protein n=1 Tax=Aestuariirhabdus litorea TaxID=2528527 RepID=A0A3P3VLK8_9GAMM|nr:bile acid:sodium symporter family protein [Aestuariirhabdus litorea]RRJ83642.1 bile acid:sodium symporter family protein [Aestuariirhabdus litorea]RWW96863.1 bile acid:sodium symporter family protein [Endozoicomonadaceae bacterium GTF-13]